MKTYWDYREKERAEMTRETVESLVNVEMMTAGVLKPAAPTLASIESVPVGGKSKFFGINFKGQFGSNEHLGVCFPSIEEANRFIELHPLLRDYDYEVGTEFPYVKYVSEAAIVVEELYTLDQINTFRSQLKNRKAATEENARLIREFENASQKADKATKGVWEDWYKCASTKSKMAGIVATFKEYVSLAGDRYKALLFLEKAHITSDINEAREWFPGEIESHAQPEDALAQ